MGSHIDVQTSIWTSGLKILASKILLEPRKIYIAYILKDILQSLLQVVEQKV